MTTDSEFFDVSANLTIHRRTCGFVRGKRMHVANCTRLSRNGCKFHRLGLYMELWMLDNPILALMNLVVLLKRYEGGFACNIKLS